MVYTHNGILVIKRNTFESVLMRQTNLELIIQSEVSQKEKYKYRILAHIYGTLKDGTDEFIFGTAMEKQTENRPKDMGVGRERMKCMERETWKLTIPYIK